VGKHPSLAVLSGFPISVIANDLVEALDGAEKDGGFLPLAQASDQLLGFRGHLRDHSSGPA